MAKYRVKEKSFIGNVLVEAGAEIEFEGVPSGNLEPLDGAGKKAVAGAQDADRESLVRQQEAAAGINLSDPDDPARKVLQEGMGAA